ncbi:receptor-type tyrosine- phosphatase beta-like isoform X1, partial [Pelobates cultripes]
MESCKFPAAVENLNIVNRTTTSVFLSWLTPEGNRSSYALEVSGTPSKNLNLSSLDTFALVDGLVPGNFYIFTIYAKDGNGLTGNTTLTFSYTVPAAVENLNIVNRTTTSVFLSWLTPEGNRSSYALEVSGTPSKNLNLSSLDTFALVDGLVPGNFYIFTIYAKDGNGLTGNTNLTFSYTVPAAVENLNIVNRTTTSVFLSWLTPEGNRSSYALEVSGTPSKNLNLSSLDTFALVDGLVPGNFYIFTIYAKDGNGLTGNTTLTFSYTVPAAVENLNIVNRTTTSVFLSWLTPEGNRSSYALEVSGTPSKNLNLSSLDTFALVDGLVPGNFYIFTIYAKDGNGLTGNTTLTFSYTVPAAVENLNIVNRTTTSVFLSWLTPEGNRSSYALEVSGTPSKNLNLSSLDTFALVDGLVPGNFYIFTIYAKDGNGLTGNTTLTFSYTVPAAVENLNIVNRTTTSVFLSWLTPEGNRSSYALEVSGTPSKNLNLSSLDTFALVDGLVPGNFYIFTIYAKDGNGLTGNTTLTFSYTVPAAVENLNIVNRTTTSVFLSWLTPEGNRSSYALEVSGTPSKNLNLSSLDTFALVDGLVPGNFYIFTIYAKDGNGLTGNTTLTFSYTVPAAVENLNIVNRTTTSVFLSWLTPEGNRSSYALEVSGTPSKNLNLSSLDTFALVDGLVPGNFYIFTIYAKDGNGLTGNTTLTFSYTVPAAVENLNIVNRTTTSVFLSWLTPEGNRSSYALEVSGTPSKNLNLSSLDTFALVDGLVPGNFYIFTIYAKDGNGLTGNTTLTFSYTVPTAVENLNIVNRTTTSVFLSWLTPEGNRSSYALEVSGTPSKNLNLSSLDTFALVDGLVPGNFYIFTIYAKDGNGLTGNTTLTFSYAVPAAVENLNIVNRTTTSVFLSWLTPEGNRSSYALEVSGTPSKNLNLSSLDTFALVDGLVPGNFYIFTIYAKDGNGLTGNTTLTFSYTVPAAVENLNIVNRTTTSVFLSWLTPEGNRSSYALEVSGTPSKNLNLSSLDTFALVDGLVPGNFYIFTIYAKDGNGLTGNTTLTFSYTVPAAVEHLNIVNRTTTSVFLSWLTPEGNRSSYALEVSGTPSKNLNLSSLDTFALVDGLVPGNFYIFTIYAKDGNGLTGNTTLTFSYTVPAAVENLNIVNRTTTSVFLSWLTPEGNRSSYALEVSGTPSKNLNLSSLDTFALVDGLVPGNFYIFTIYAKDGNGLTGNTTLTFSYTVPAAVENLNIVNRTTTSVFLSWLTPEGNRSSYALEVSGTPSKNLNLSSLDTFALVDGLVPGNFYIFTIYAKDGNGLTGNTTLTFSYTVPAAVENLNIVNRTTTSVFLSWLTPEGNRSSYALEVSGTPSKNLNLSSLDTFALVDGLVPGNFYIFTIYAKDGNGLTGNTTLTFSYTVPAAVENLNIVNRTTTSVFLSWLTPEGNRSSYALDVSGTPSKNLNLSSLATFALVDGLVPGNFYIFTIYAKDGNGLTGNTNLTFSYTVPAAVENLNIVNRTTTSVFLSWLTPEGNRSSYALEVSGTPSKNLNLSSLDTFALVDGLVPGNFYIFTIYAKDGNGLTGNTTLTFSYTVPAAVENLNIVNRTTTSVFLSWLTPEGNRSSYALEVSGTPSKNLNLSSLDTFALVDGLVPGNFYIFTIYAKDGNGLTGNTTLTFSYTVPTAVENLNIVNRTTTSVFLSWLTPEGNRSSYALEVSGTPSKNLNLSSLDTFALVDGLVPGNFYIFTIYAKDGNGLTGNTTLTFSYTVPAAVENLNIVNRTTTSVFLSWLTPEGNRSSYALEVSGTPSKNLNLSSLDTFALVDGLVPGNFYIFTIYAKDGNGLTGNTTLTFSYAVPAAVENLNIVNRTTTSVFLSWLTPEGNRSSYALEVSGTPSKNLNLSSLDTFALVDGLVPGNFYIFTIYAKDGNGLTGNTTLTFSYTVPAAVENLNIVNRTTTSVFLSWLTPEGNRSSYALEVSGIPSKNLNLSSLDTFALVDGLVPGNFYVFTFYAKDGNGLTGNTTLTFSYTVPAAVENLNIVNRTTTSVFLSWLTPEGNRSSYALEVSGTPSKNLNLSSLDTFALVDGLVPGNFYIFRIYAKDENGLTGNTTQTFSYTVPESVTNITVSNITLNSAVLSWMAPRGNISSYLISVQSSSINITSITREELIFVGNLTAGMQYTFIVCARSGGNTLQGQCTSISAST